MDRNRPRCNPSRPAGRAGVEELASLDVDGLTDAELHELVVASERLVGRLAAATAPALARCIGQHAEAA